jgi:hypothetical protein
MGIEKSNFGDVASASIIRNADSDEVFGIQGYYNVKCYDSEGNLKWEDIAPNLVTAIGKQSLFDYYFGATGTGGGTAAGANYLGLVGSSSASTTYLQSDTMSSHAGWIEVGGTNAPAYTGNRQAPSWSASTNNGSASPSNIVSKTASALTFSMTSSGTVYGCFINGGASASATKDTTAGVLYSAGNFTGGSKTVANGDSLAITYTTTATS